MLLADKLILVANILLLKLAIKRVLYVLAQLLELIVAFILSQLAVSYVWLFLGVVELAAVSVEVAVVVRWCVLAICADVEVCPFIVGVSHITVLLIAELLLLHHLIIHIVLHVGVLALVCGVLLATIEHVGVWLVENLRCRLLRLAEFIYILAELIDIRHLFNILVVLFGIMIVCLPTIFLFDVPLGIGVGLAAIGLSRLGHALGVAVEVLPAVFMDYFFYVIITS